MYIESSDSRPEFRCESKYVKFTTLREHIFSTEAKKDKKIAKFRFSLWAFWCVCVLSIEAQGNPLYWPI